MHPLDRPVWASLTSRLAAWAEGGSLARRFQRGVNVFMAAADESPPALQALADLVRADEEVYALQVPPVRTPPGLLLVKSAPGLQMVGTRAAAAGLADEQIVELGEHDAPEMLALAQLTRPGPFLARTHSLGGFVGVRQGGALIAMAGERFRQPGYTEISGVCTHPGCRGQGLARRLSACVASRIQARGEQAYLHVWASNAAAIALYETLGFELRAQVHVAVLQRAQ